eukprot:687222-Amorphochlora_amoeboformis.AAC.1
MGGGEKTALGIGLSLATDSDGGPDLHLEGEMDELVKLVKTKAEQIRSPFTFYTNSNYPARNYVHV